MKHIKAGVIAISILFTWLIVSGPLKPYSKVLRKNQSPEIILVLGGDIKREKVGIQIAKSLQLPLLLSGGSNPEHAEWLINKSGLSRKVVTLDYRAQDTLSNFTSTIDELASNKINHILVITSEDHINRAMLIGHIVAGSRGIRLTGLPVSCNPNCKEESLRKKIFDLIRAVTWVNTGKDPKELLQTQI